MALIQEWVLWVNDDFETRMENCPPFCYILTYNYNPEMFWLILYWIKRFETRFLHTINHLIVWWDTGTFSKFRATL